MAENTKLIDITRLGEYDVLLKQFIDDKFDAISQTIGTVPAKLGEGENEQDVANLIDYIQKSITLINGAADGIKERVAANEVAIGAKESVITAEAYAALTEEQKALYVQDGENYKKVATGLFKYVDDAAAAAITKVVADANADYDTLVEIENWINSELDGAAAMQNAIKYLKGTDGTVHTKNSVSIPGALLYVDSIVAGKNADADAVEGELLMDASATSNKVSVESTEKLQNAVERAEGAVLSVKKAETNVENYVDLTVTDGDDATVGISDARLSAKIEGVYSDIQGDTDTTIEDLNGTVGALKAVGSESPSTVVEYINKKSEKSAADLQGGTESTLKDVEDKVDALEIADADSVSALFGE